MPATYEPIATTTLGSAAANITFSSIPGTYTDLRLVMVVRSTVVATTADLRIDFNGDTAANYSRTNLSGDGTSALSSRSTGQTRLVIARPNAASATAGIFSLVTADIFSYAGSTYKTVLSTMANDNNGSGTVFNQVGLWRGTGAITSIVLTPQSNNFAADTTATLYGILKA